MPHREKTNLLEEEPLDNRALVNAIDLELEEIDAAIDRTLARRRLFLTVRRHLAGLLPETAEKVAEV